jgi:HKD family nuclease
MTTELITNSTALNHLRTLLGRMRATDRVSVATAFLSASGLSRIASELKEALRRGVTVEFYCGLDRYVTEPSALQVLHDMCRRSLAAQLFLVGGSGDAMFHPKLYYFRKGNISHIVVGSANLTGGGLVDNFEVSASVTVPSSDPLAQDTEELFGKIAALPGSQHATDLTISLYRAKYDKYHAKVDHAQRNAEKEASTKAKVDIANAGRYLDRYRKAADGQEDFEDRRKRYGSARMVLEQMCRPGLTRDEFVTTFDRLTKKPDHLWASDPLYRSQRDIFAGYRRFVEVVSLVRRSTDLEPGKLFDAAMRVRPDGMGTNHVTEVMATYAPNRFAVLNNRTLAVLDDMACEHFPAPFGFSGGLYAQYNSLLSEIRDRLGFKWLLQVDHYFNWCYDHMGI